MDIWAAAILGFIVGNVYSYFSLVRPIIALKDGYIKRLQERLKKRT